MARSTQPLESFGFFCETARQNRSKAAQANLAARLICIATNPEQAARHMLKRPAEVDPNVPHVCRLGRERMLARKRRAAKRALKKII